MKKLFLFFCLALFGAAFAGESENPTMWELVNTPVARKAEAKLKSVKMVFLVKGKDIPDTLVMFRANRTGEFRIDSLSAEGSFAVGGTESRIWGWDTEKGEHKISDAELNELTCDVALLPIPFMKRDFFKPPVLQKSEEVQGILCNCWKAVDKSGKYKVRLWVSQKDSRLLKVESDAGGDVLVTLYERYCIFNGVEMASVIRQIDRAGNTYTLELQNLQWNIIFTDKVFRMPKKGELLTLEREMLKTIRKVGKTSDEEVGKNDPKRNFVVLRVEPEPDKKTKLRKRIARLEAEIQGYEGKVSRANSAAGAGVIGGLIDRLDDACSGNWYRRGYRYGGRRRTYRGRRSGRIDWQSRVRKHEDDWNRRMLVEKKIELSNAKIDLENLQ